MFPEQIHDPKKAQIRDQYHDEDHVRVLSPRQHNPANSWSPVDWLTYSLSTSNSTQKKVISGTFFPTNPFAIADIKGTAHVRYIIFFFFLLPQVGE